jgi:hypothetical protein
VDNSDVSTLPVMMTSGPSVYCELAAALRERLAVIADREHFQRDADGHLDRLKAVGARIEALRAQLPGDHDPRLGHFLQRCSFEKALAFLEG